jgi:putative copper export protein
MNGGLALEAITRGLHDVFAAVWAGGLLIMALVVMPTMKSMRAGTPQGPAEAGRAADAKHGTAPGPARFMVLVQKRLRVVVTVAIVGVFATGLLMLRLSLLSSGGLDPRSLYGAILIAKVALSVVMVVIAIIRTGKLRRLGDAPGDPKASGIPLLFANASLALVVLLLSGVAGAIGA